MAQDLATGQFWKDTINGDVLKILEIDDSTEAETPYVRCACYPRGEYFLGIQEMKTEHLEKRERFQQIKLGRSKRFWWTLVKFRKP